MRRGARGARADEDAPIYARATSATGRAPAILPDAYHGRRGGVLPVEAAAATAARATGRRVAAVAAGRRGARPAVERLLVYVDRWFRTGAAARRRRARCGRRSSAPACGGGLPGRASGDVRALARNLRGCGRACWRPRSALVRLHLVVGGFRDRRGRPRRVVAVRPPRRRRAGRTARPATRAGSVSPRGGERQAARMCSPTAWTRSRSTDGSTSDALGPARDRVLVARRGRRDRAAVRLGERDGRADGRAGARRRLDPHRRTPRRPASAATSSAAGS